MRATQDAVATYGIDMLLAEGFTRRQIERFRTAGLLPPAHGRGPAAYYTDIHLRIVRAIRAARDERVTPTDIAERYGREFKGWHGTPGLPDAVPEQ